MEKRKVGFTSVPLDEVLESNEFMASVPLDPVLTRDGFKVD